MHPFDLIIFDFDGTLADSAPGICACMAAAFNSFGLPRPTMADVRPTIGLTLEESIRQLTARHGLVDITAVARAYRDLHETVAAPATADLSCVDHPRRRRCVRFRRSLIRIKVRTLA